MNPATWSAKAQSIAAMLVACLVAAAVAVANAKLGWNLDAPTVVHLVLGVLGLGGVGAAAIAHIDNGESDVPATRAPVFLSPHAAALTDEQKQALVALTPQPAKAELAALLGVALPPAPASTPAQ